MKKHTILVVEDEALIAANLVHILSSLGYDVPEPAATGEDALLLVKTKKPDLVLMDIQLIGEMNGIETAEKIRAIADIPVVYLTAFADDLRLKQAKLTDPYGYLIKPVHSRELHATIQMALYKHALDLKLKESEELLRSTLASMDDLVFTLDENGIFLESYHPVMKNLYAMPEQFIGKSFGDILPKELAEQIQKAINNVKITGATQQFEYSLLLDGKFSWFSTKISPRYSLKGTFRGVTAVARDITERKNTDTAFQTMIRGMVGTTGFNSLQKITETISSWLGAECVMVGEIQPDRQTVKVLSMLLDGKNIPDFTYSLKGTPCDNVAEKGFCIYPDNVIGLFPQSKDLVDLNIRGYIGTPLRNSQGHVIGILCALFRNPVKASPAVQEIMTIIAVKAAAEIERKQAEEELKASEGKLNAMLQSIPDHMSMMDKDLNLIWTNETAKRVFGDDIVGKKCYEIYHQRQNPCEPYPCLTLRAFQDGKVHKHETSVLDVNGQAIYFECSANVALHDESGKPVAVLEVSRDITERKKAEENLVATLKRTQDQQAALNTISFSPLLFSGDVHGLSARLTELSSQVFGVERASVWLFTSKGDELRCIDLYEVMYDRHTYDNVLKRSEYVNEFEALSTAKFIDAHDPLTDPRTAGYVKSYVKPNHITSMLTAVIRVSGQNLGVLCFEHVDCSHHWENDEIAFACQLADQIAITLLNRDRKRVEEALKESEEKYRNLFMAGADGIVVHDAQGRNIDANAQACEMLGYSHSELLAMRVSDLIPKEDLKQKPPRLTEVMAGQTVCYERKLQRKDGTLLDLEIRASRVAENTVQAFWRDITERKRAEELINESARYTRNLIEVSLDPLVTISPEGKITDVNAATERVTGYTRNHLIGTDFSDYFTDPMNAKKGYMMVFEDGVVRDYPLEIRHRDGKVTPVMYNATIYPDESGNAKGIFAAARDITERKIAEEALYQANKKLNLLTSITRHDINNQLTVLTGYLTILKKKQTDPILNDYFVKVSTAAQRISSMIRFTKEYESIGVKAPAWQNCRTVADTAAKDAQPGQVMIQNDLPNSAEVFADPLVVKVFYNLIDNAVRYGEKITTIRFFVEEAGDDHIIVCEDDGEGVVADEKKKIFERGFGKNTGLGLALAREILDITGITITECGEPGTGARFEMTVPKGAWRIQEFR